MSNYFWFQATRVNLYIPKEIGNIIKSETVVSDFSLHF